jgi:hypothetical protein
MSAAYQAQVEATTPFDNSRRMFESMATHLASRDGLSMDHAALEGWAQEQGRELTRQLLQDHFDLRMVREHLVRVRDADGVERCSHRESRRTLRSLVGDVTLGRVLYQESGYEGLCPADAELRLPEDSYSMGVRREVAGLVAQSSYAEACGTLERLTGVDLGLRQAEELAQRAAQDVLPFYAEREVEPETDDALMLLSFDAAGIIMRRESLRQAARRAAEKAEPAPSFPPKLKTGEKPNRKRMAQVAAVYGVAPFPRTPDDILGELSCTGLRDATKPMAARPRPMNKRVWASVKRSCFAVVDEAFQEAIRRDPNQERPWVVLVDGHRDQLRAVRRAAAKHGVEVTIVVDLIHLIEYLWPAAYCFHEAGSTEARDWVVEKLRALLEGARPSDVAGGMRRSATLRRVTKRAAVDKCAKYMLKLAPYMNYGDAIASGLPIATGVIEGACRHLVRARLDGTGARWSADGAEAVLLLRALHLSRDFDAYWEFHQTRDYERTHPGRYADGVVPKQSKLRLVR